MRKTQVALAALALVASSAALADVAVYGQVDASVVSNSDGTAFAGQGNSMGSLWGVKGSEDLGGGLKAGFNLESGLNINSGALGGNGGVKTALFNRAANVSLGTEAATVTLGTQISPFIVAGLAGTTAVGGNGAFVPALIRLDGGSLATISVGGTATGGFFIQDAASVSLNGGGFAANILYRVKEKSSSDSAYSAANVTTSVAGINLALGYQSLGTTTASSERTNIVVAGNTTVAGVRLNAAYSDNGGNTANKSTGYILGASMPLVGALSGGLTFSDNSKATVGRATTFSLQYDMSKATYAYLNYSSFGVKQSGGYVANDDAGLAAAKSLLAVGLAHAF